MARIVSIALSLAFIAAAGAVAVLATNATGAPWQTESGKRIGAVNANTTGQPPLVFPNFFATACKTSAFELRTEGRNLEFVVKSIGDKVNVDRSGPILSVRAEDRDCPRRYRITVEIESETNKEP